MTFISTPVEWMRKSSPSNWTTSPLQVNRIQLRVERRPFVCFSGVFELFGTKDESLAKCRRTTRLTQITNATKVRTGEAAPDR